MNKIKKITAVLLSGMVICTTPVTAVASAENTTEQVIMENVETLLSDPDKVTDIVVYVKDMIDRQEITADQISKGVDMAADTLGISLTDSEKESLVNVAEKVMDIEIDEEKLRSQISGVYDKMESIGIGKEEVKGILRKIIDFAKNILN